MDFVVLVDRDDNCLGTEEKMKVHEAGLLHRAFSVFIVRKWENQLEVLLQKRAQDKYHCGGLWTNTCCSHPRRDETIEMAAERRLLEEMGFSADLIVLDKFHYRASFSNGLIENEIDHVLVGLYDESEIRPNPEEASDYRWLQIHAIQQALTAEPHYYTPWLAPALDIVVRERSAIDTLFAAA